MANTTWNPADLTGVTLSNGNLTASSGAFGGCRAIDNHFTGKYYWEITWTTLSSNTSGGLYRSVTALGGNPSTVGTVYILPGATQSAVDLDGSQVLLFSVPYSTGTPICFAFDADNRLFWVRIGAAGNWNNSAGANPATGIGGLFTPYLGKGYPAYPAFSSPSSGNVVTANFGDSAFVGTVPSGFTAGWPSGTGSAIGNVRLLCHFDGVNGSTTFTDTGGGHTLTPNNCTVNTTAPKFGTGAGDFSVGTSASINTGNYGDFNIGSAQFTVEAFVYFTSTPSGGGVYGVLTQFGASANLGWFLGHVSGAAAFYYSTTGSDNPSVGAAWTPTLNTWYHLAADRDASNVIRVYVNGAVVASATVASAIYASTQTCYIGNDHNGNRAFPGYIDEARVTIGLARYGGAFTPPSVPFPDSPGSGNAVATQGSIEAWTASKAFIPFQVLTTQVAVEQWASSSSFIPYRLSVTQAAVEVWATVQNASFAASANAWILT